MMEWLYCRCGSGAIKNKCKCGRKYEFKSYGRASAIWIVEVSAQQANGAGAEQASRLAKMTSWVKRY